MPEADVIHPQYSPLTVDSLASQLSDCGLGAGQNVIVHTRMSELGWVVGGAVAIVEALLRVLGPSGTLMMPTHTAGNTDPSEWQFPPVPRSWWPIIRDQMPAYDPATTPSRNMGQVAELFRTLPGTLRSAHPAFSFAARGLQAAFLTEHHRLKNDLGPESPLDRLYQLDGHILLLGVGHGNNTSLHLAEARAKWRGKRHILQGSAMLVDGVRQWVAYESLDVDSDDFPAVGDDYEREHGIPRGRVGRAEVRFMKQRPLVDYAVRWFEKHRRKFDAEKNNQ